MTDYVFRPEVQPSVAVRDSAQRYAVHRIFCVGRNYAAHAREM
ncbi:MAG: FAA hydrolase family protein, partial [Roseateles sp.]